MHTPASENMRAEEVYRRWTQIHTILGFGVENAGAENVAPECMLSCLCLSEVKQFVKLISSFL